MKQKQIKSVDALLAQSTKAIGGATQYGTELALTNTADLISSERGALVTARDNYGTGKNVLASKRAVMQSVKVTARAFEKTTRNVLEKDLGSKYSPAWEIVGFKGSLRIPTAVDAVLVLAERMQSYLTAQPTAQVEALNVTAVRAGALVTDLTTAQNAANAQLTTVKQLLKTRNDAEAVLQKRLRDLILELRQKLGSLDPRWLAFGLNMPGAKAIPSVPDNVTAVLIGETAAAVKWDASERAEYYRVWKRVVGVDTEFVAVGSPADRDFTIEGLPRNATIELVISAVNNGGESGKSTVVTVTTH